MNNLRNLSCGAAGVLSLAALLLVPGVQALGADYGTVTGQFVLDGPAPEPKKLVIEKDAAVCAAQDHYEKTLVVDEESKGIAHVFVYIYYRDAAKLDIPADLKQSKEKEVVFDQKNCEFIPYGLVVRTDQTVLVKSDDAVAHNTHTYTIRSEAINLIIPPKDREGIPVRKPNPELQPMPVKCDIHPWMEAYWLVVDHPYAVITDKQGKFTVEGLPAGEHEFRVWHKTGYVAAGAPRGFTVTVKPGETADLGTVKLKLEDDKLRAE